MAQETDPKGEMTLNKWQRKLERASETSEAMKKFTNKNLAETLKKNTRGRSRLAREFIEHLRGNRGKSQFQGNEEGYNLKGVEDEIITGFEPLPWDIEPDEPEEEFTTPRFRIRRVR